MMNTLMFRIGDLALFLFRRRTCSIYVGHISVKSPLRPTTLRAGTVLSPSSASPFHWPSQLLAGRLLGGKDDDEQAADDRRAERAIRSGRQQ